MKIIRLSRITIEFSQEELEALYEILKGPNSAEVWENKGCTPEQVNIGSRLYAQLRLYLNKP